MSAMETNPDTEAADSWEEISSPDIAQLHRSLDGKTDAVVAAEAQVVEESSESPAEGEEVVKRLLADPADLCCPLSGRLMEDPVVAADGVTYERSWVEERLAQAPGKSPSTGHGIETAVLLPNKHMESLILCFKAETIKEILFVVPTLSADQAEQLVKRGEGFLRPCLPNASLTKQLARSCLSTEIHQHILNQEDGSDVEKIYLKLSLQGEEDIPRDVLSKLTLPTHHLSECSPSQLMLLVDQLKRNNRPRDAARVAVVAAKAFASRGQEKESGEAFLQAFALDPFNPDAAEGVTRLAKSRLTATEEHELEDSHGWTAQGWPAQGMTARGWPAWSLKVMSSPLSWLFLLGVGCMLAGCMMVRMPVAASGYNELEHKVQGLQGELRKEEYKVQGLRGELGKEEDKVQGLQGELGKEEQEWQHDEKKLHELQKAQESGPFVWDLSGYNFSDFKKGDWQDSHRFQLRSGIKAWMELYPKGNCDSSKGMAGLYLCVDKPVVVKWTWQSGSSGAWTKERDFSKELQADGTIRGWGNAAFMPISEANGRITLRVLRVQQKGSTHI